MNTVKEAYKDLEPDPWRASNGFSADILSVHEKLFNANSREDMGQAINAWLKSSNYPCLFGRKAATNGQIALCILCEEDLLKDDNHVSAIISNAREDFYRNAMAGKQSAFIILAVSQRIVDAKPSAAVYRLAEAITRLYLSDDIPEVRADYIYTERIPLAMPSRKGHVKQWKAGVNYFSVHGDQRWWHDHRIPGGMGLSVNSPGHLVASCQLEEWDQETAEHFKINSFKDKLMSVRDLGAALEVAMRSVDNSAECPFGRSTRLYSRDEKPVPENMEISPSLPGKLGQMNHCVYAGWYHTDHTLPSVFFQEDITRPDSIPEEHELDFTYLFHDSEDNPDFKLMGEGIQIRSTEAAQVQVSPRRFKTSFKVVKIRDWPLLYKALHGSVAARDGD